MHICVIYEWATFEHMQELVQTLKDAGHTVFFHEQIDGKLAEEAADVMLFLHHGGGLLSSPDPTVRKQTRKACRESYDTIKKERERKAAEQKAMREAQSAEWKAEREKRIQEAIEQESHLNGLRLFE